MAALESEIKPQPNLDQTETILEETFYVLSKNRLTFRVKLTRSGLVLVKECENQVKIEVIPIRDIIGCRCLRSRKQKKSCACQPSFKKADGESEENNGDTSAYLHIHAYILQSNPSERERYKITLRFRSFDEYEDNYREAQKWRSVMKKLIQGEEVHDYNAINHLNESCKVLVLLSPKSGSGKGRALFQNKIVPILQEAEVPYDLHVTKYANYAREFVRTSDLLQWRGVVVVGGDGVVFEVINGILERPDWSEVLNQIPIGVVPGGSGNGLARSIAYSCAEPYDSPTLPAALAIVRNRTAPMDLVRVETASEVVYSFLSIGWGLLSDIDVESESLRVLGGQRFAVWSMARLVGLRTYKGKVYYLSAFADSFKKSLARGEGSEESSTEKDSSGSSQKPRIYGPESQLPPLTDSLPSYWTCRSGKFVMVHASYQTHISSDCFFAPNAKLNDELIWLIIMHASASRAQILQFLLGLSSGTHVNSQVENDAVEVVPVVAFRIEPDLDEQGYLTVDGELVEYGPIQAEVFPGLVRVMVP